MSILLFSCLLLIIFSITPHITFKFSYICRIYFSPWKKKLRSLSCGFQEASHKWIRVQVFWLPFTIFPCSMLHAPIKTSKEHIRTGWIGLNCSYFFSWDWARAGGDGPFYTKWSVPLLDGKLSIYTKIMLSSPCLPYQAKAPTSLVYSLKWCRVNCLQNNLDFLRLVKG